MQSRFQTMSDSIITRIDEMGERIDDLERSVQDLVTQADGAEDGSAPTNALAKPGQSRDTHTIGRRKNTRLAM